MSNIKSHLRTLDNEIAKIQKWFNETNTEKTNVDNIVVKTEECQKLINAFQLLMTISESQNQEKKAIVKPLIVN